LEFLASDKPAQKEALMLAVNSPKLALVRLAVVTSFFVAFAGDARWATIASAQQLEPDHFIAHRLDEARVVFVLDTINANRRKLHEEVRSGHFATLPTPKAVFSGIGPLWRADKATLSPYAEEITMDRWTKLHMEDLWVIRAGPNFVFHMRIESLAIARVHCSMHLAVIGRVVNGQAEGFMAVKSKYYLVVPEAEFVPVSLQRTSQRPALLDWTNNRQRPLSPDLESAIREQFERELGEFQRGDRFAKWVRRGSGRIKRMQGILERHAPGEGNLMWDQQVLRLTPEGEKRVYVRSQLTLEEREVFFMSCWFNPENLQAERVKFRTSISEGGWTFSLETLGMILNVFDRDGDGWGEVLIGTHGYESFRIRLIEYSESGFEDTGIEFSGGC